MVFCSRARTLSTTARARPASQGGEGGQPGRFDFRMRRQRIVGADFPVGEREDFLRPAVIEGEVGGELLDLPVVGGQYQQRLAALGEQGGQQARRRRTGQAEHLAVRRGGDPGDKGAHGGMGNFRSVAGRFPCRSGQEVKTFRARRRVVAASTTIHCSAKDETEAKMPGAGYGATAGRCLLVLRLAFSSRPESPKRRRNSA